MFGLLSVAVFTYGVYLSCINCTNQQIEQCIIPQPLWMHRHEVEDEEQEDSEEEAESPHVAIDIISQVNEKYTYDNDEPNDSDDTDSDTEYDTLNIVDALDSDSDVDNINQEVTEDIRQETADTGDTGETEETEETEETDETAETAETEETGENGGVVVEEDVGMDHEVSNDIGDLWSSYQLDMKYDEMKNKKPLNTYLNLREWKMAVRRRFNEFIKSEWFRSDPEKFIRRERSKRNKDQYAVIDDTALNLVEYYHIKSSKEE